MKKATLIISTLVFVFTAQLAKSQLVNSGFETWTVDAIVPTAMNPNSGNNTYGWWDYNYFNSALVGSSPISVIRATDTVRTGSYAVRLESKIYTPTSWGIYANWGIPFIGHDYNDTLGILFNGKVDVNTQTFVPGIAFSQKITQFKFYYQYQPNGNDTAECRVSLMNGSTIVAGGLVKISGATGNTGWQEAIVDIAYISTIEPDTMYILFSSTSLDGAPKTGSILWIDDVSVSLPTGIEQKLGDTENISVYPNPFSSTTTIEFENSIEEIHQLNVIDYTGKVVHSITNITANKVVLNRENLSNGIYLIQIQNSKGTVYTKKMVVK